MSDRPNREFSIANYLSAAGDSVRVIEMEIQKLPTLTSEEDIQRSKKIIRRNVDHLKIVVADSRVIASGENTANLQTAIAQGEAAIA
jgi:hypothetical protein